MKEYINCINDVTVPNPIILQYPTGSDAMDVVSLSQESAERLGTGAWFNDDLIDLGMKYITNTSVNITNPIHIMSAHFMATLIDKGYDSVKTWSKHFSLFEKDCIIVPVILSMHWSLLVILKPTCLISFDTNEKCCIIHLDSLCNNNSLHDTDNFGAKLKE